MATNMAVAVPPPSDPPVVIVKVQRSLATSAGAPQILVYDEPQDIVYEGPLTPEVDALLGADSKAFFVAKRIDAHLELGPRVPWQDW